MDKLRKIAPTILFGGYVCFIGFYLSLEAFLCSIPLVIGTWGHLFIPNTDLIVFITNNEDLGKVFIAETKSDYDNYHIYEAFITEEQILEMAKEMENEEDEEDEE